MVFSRQQNLLEARKIQTILPTMLIFSGVLVLFFASTESRHQSISNEINENGKRYFQKIEGRLNISNSKLGSYEAFYHGSDHISRKEFNAFSRVILKNDAVFQGIGWTEIVPASKRTQYEAKIRTNGFPNFSFTEMKADGSLQTAPPRDEYYPVIYIYPIKSNIKALGLNLAANPQRLKALIKAREQVKAFATAPITLAQETTSQFAYYLFTHL